MHKVTSVMMAAALVLGTIACGPSHPGGQLPPSNTVVHRILPGASTIINPGTQAGYGITANTGGAYRIVWTGDAAASGTYRNFNGSIWTPGSFGTITRGCAGNFCPLENDDVVSNPVTLSNAQRIDFDANATSGIDGFDFVVTLEPVYFDLLIDGVRNRDLVFFPATDNGGAVSVPAAVPFGLTTN